MNNTRYKIQITEFTTEPKMCGKDWEPVNNNPEADYQYTPEIEKQVAVERTLYLQNTDSLDLSKVIMAINGIMPRND